MQFKSTDPKEVVQELGSAFEEYKHINDERYKQLEKGVNDPQVKQNLDNVIKAIGELEEVKETAERAEAMARKMAIAGSKADADPMMAKQRAAICEFYRGEKGVRETKNFDSLALHEKSFSTGSDPNGGYLVRPYLDNTILQLQLETSSLRKYASTVTISTDFYEQVASLDNQDVYWGDDFTPTANVDNEPNDYEKLRIHVKNLRANIPVPENLLNDAYFDLESNIMQQTARKFAYAENLSFITGNGVKQPMGILSYPNGNDWGKIEQIPSGSNSALTDEGLIDLVYSLLSFYTNNARFLMNRTTIAEVRKLKYGTNFPVPMWQPSLVAGQPSTIMGYPVEYTPEMPAFASGVKAIAFGDFSQGYLIVDRAGMTVLRDPFTRHPKVVFKFTKRVGGGLRDYRAIKILTIST